MSADRNLLFGILALQMDFITRDQLIAAMSAWALAKHRPLGEILVEQKALPPAKRDLLEPLVDQHVKDHGNDPQKSLAAVSSVSSIREQLKAVPDADVQVSLGFFGINTDSTISHVESSGDASRYRILRPHARGGIGEVYVAEDTELHRQVALKEIQPAKDRGDNRSRFVLEAEITGGLEHPGIVPVYGLGHYSDGRPYYAMRFIKGDNLGEAIKRFHGLASVGALARREVEDQNHVGLTARRSPDFDSLEFRRLLQRFIDVCNAVAYAHSRGVLHRDLKPGNIMLGKYGETLIVDWGLAKLAGRMDSAAAMNDENTLQPTSGSSVSPTAYGSAIGTPAYMSPEQAEGKLDQLGPASDVYSLGATLYHLLVGKPPNADCDAMQTIVRSQKGEVSTPLSINAAIPKPLNAVCVKAMSLKPADRYAAAQGLAVDVEHWLADEPVGAWAEPASVRVKRWARRHSRLTASLAATLVVGAVALGALAWQRERAREAVELEQAQTAIERDTAKKERDRAAEQKDIAVAVSNFLRNKLLQQFDTEVQADSLLAAGRPVSEAELDPKISVLFARAAAELTPDKIESRFPNQPLVQAEILQTIGDAYRGMGKYPEAISHLERARDVRVAKLGADHMDTLTTLNNLAIAYQFSGRLPEAIQVHEQVRDVQVAKCGASHPNTLSTLCYLANAYLVSDNLPEAIRLFEQVRDAQVAKLGADHPTTLATIAGLASAYAQSGKLPEAIQLYKQVCDASVAKLGTDHPSTLVTLHNLAWAYETSGNLSEAIRLLEQVRDAQVTKLGADHPYTLTTLHNIALAYQESGKLPEAIQLFEQVRDARLAKLGTDHRETLRTIAGLASAYRASGELPEAIRLFEQVRDAQAAKLGADHPLTLTTLNNLAVAYKTSGRLPEAIRLCEQVRDARIAKLGADHPDTLTTLNNLAAAYQDSGKLREAIQLYEQVRDAQVAKLGADHLSTLNTLNNLAGAYKDSGRLHEAIQLYEQVRDAQVAKLGADHLSTLNTLNNLAGAYKDSGRLHEAIQLYEQVRDAQVAKLGADHLDTLTTLNNLAVAYSSSGKRAEAIQLYEQVREARIAKLGVDHPSTLTTLYNLASAYRAAGNLLEAIRLYEQAVLVIEKRQFQDKNAGQVVTGTAQCYEQLKEFGKAEVWRRKWLAVVKEKSGAESMAYAMELAGLGRNLSLQQDFAGAETVLRECLIIRQTKEPELWNTFNTKSVLGGALAGQKKYSEAEPLLLAGYEGMKQRIEKILPRDRIRLTEAAERLVQLYDAMDKPDEVAKWRTELETMKKAEETKP
jgi:eukaryotic-like serine/threonine-protein kinase